MRKKISVCTETLKLKFQIWGSCDVPVIAASPRVRSRPVAFKASRKSSWQQLRAESLSAPGHSICVRLSDRSGSGMAVIVF